MSNSGPLSSINLFTIFHMNLLANVFCYTPFLKKKLSYLARALRSLSQWTDIEHDFLITTAQNLSHIRYAKQQKPVREQSGYEHDITGYDISSTMEYASNNEASRSQYRWFRKQQDYTLCMRGLKCTPYLIFISKSFKSLVWGENTFKKSICKWSVI